MIDFFVKGGIFMYPILLCSVTAVAIFVERLWRLRRSQVIPSDLVERVEALIRREKIQEAIDVCRQNGSSMARVLLVAIKNIGKKREALKDYLEEVGRQESASLERFVEALGTIPGVSTLLGLLGTISGMIKIFSVISTEPVVNPQLLAGGISEALITTFAGLSVAIPAIVMYKWVQGKAESLILEMEESSIRMVELLQEKAESS